MLAPRMTAYNVGLGMVAVVLGLPPPGAGALEVADQEVVRRLVPEGRLEDGTVAQIMLQPAGLDLGDGEEHRSRKHRAILRALSE